MTLDIFRPSCRPGKSGPSRNRNTSAWVATGMSGWTTGGWLRSTEFVFICFFSSRRGHTICSRDWSSDVCSSDLIADLKARARRDRRIIFTGFVFGRDYRTLQQNAYCYVHATEVGGTHPALLEAMGFGNCVLTLAAPENMEAIGDAGIAYADENDLAEKLQRVLRDGSLVQSYRNRAQARVQEFYDWDYVVDQYERLFAKMAGKPMPQAIQTTAESTAKEESLSRSASA